MVLVEHKPVNQKTARFLIHTLYDPLILSRVHGCPSLPVNLRTSYVSLSNSTSKV